MDWLSICDFHGLLREVVARTGISSCPCRKGFAGISGRGVRRKSQRWLVTAILAGAASLIHAGMLSAQAPTDWDVSLPRGETREIDFTTTEGTWMSVDVSPDGSWIVFDLLGHIYRMDAEGGTAEPLTQNSGVALNYHPRISPDGRTVAFISDRGGQDNLWIMNANGSQPRVVFHDLSSRALTPAWTPDGEYIVVRRDSIARGGDGEDGLGLWMHHRDGGGGVRLVEDGAAHWPSVSPDGRYVYYHAIEGGRDRDALRGDYQLRRVDIRTGHILDITSGTAHGTASGRRSSGGAFAPEISPEGRWLAFARHIPDGTVSFKGHRFGPRTALWLLDLQTGLERIALDPINIAVESGDKNMRVLPGYAWSRDGSSILISSGGGIGRLDVPSGNVTPIPFEARVRRTISEQAYHPFRIEDGPFEAKFLRWHTGSPDGGTLAFQAVGRVWVSDLPAGTPRRLTPDSFEPSQEFGPVWSPDGEWVAFTSWDDTGGGHVWKAPVRGGGAPVRLTTEPGEYVHPAWSADGREIVVGRGSGATFRGRTFTHNPWWDLVRVPADGGDPTPVARVALPTGSGPQRVQRRAILSPSWGPEGRVFFPEIIDGGTAVVSVRPDGEDRRVHLILRSADEVAASPDGRWITFQEANNVYVAPLPQTGVGDAPLTLDRRSSDLPVRQLSRTGGLFVRWRDANSLEFGSGSRYYRHDLSTGQTETFGVRLVVPRRTIAGTIALTNARIVTFAGPGNDEVIESGTIVVNGPRIACVGACDTSGADRVIDASGRTIIPGFVDMHSHHHREHRGYRPLRDYEVGLYVAYGVTTSMDNSIWSQNLFPTAELIETGRMIGPRTFSTGDPLPFPELASREVTAEQIDRLQSWGAVSLKQHSHPRRDRRQWIADVAREKGIMLTAEGYDLEYNLGHAMDGYSGWEHPLSVIPIYSDVAKFFAQAKTVYSNPFIFDSPTAANVEYWYAESDVWKQEKQRRWMPWRMTTFLRRRMLRPDTDYSFPLIAQGLADILAEGGRGALGGHGEHHGTSIHWEIWMAATALGPMGALRTATLGSASFLGADRDLGSLEAGKLADLVVLNQNPLDNIRNTMDIRYVMKGGVLYDDDTLDEIWPEQRPFGPYSWVDEDALRSDDRPVDAWRRR